MIFVTGGTGLLGTTLLYKLTLKNQQIIALKLKSSKMDVVESVFNFHDKENGQSLFEKITWVEGDIQDFEFLQTIFEKGITHVYHCAGIVSFEIKDKNKLKKINHLATEQIVNLALKHKVEKLCFVSSVATINQVDDNNMFSEKSDFIPTIATNYAITKHLGELAVWRGIQEGLDAVIVKPSIILASNFWGSSSGKAIPVALKRKYSTKGKAGFVDVKDVTEIMVRLMDSDIKNESFIINGTNTAFSTFCDKVRVIGNKKPVIKVSDSLFKFVSKLSLIFNFISPKSKIPSGEVASTLVEKTLYDNSKIKEFLGFSFTPLDDSLKFHVNNYLNDRARRN